MMYLASGTQPDISFAVNLLARFSVNPSKDHWLALDYLVGCLKGTMGMKLEYKVLGFQLKKCRLGEGGFSEGMRAGPRSSQGWL